MIILKLSHPFFQVNFTLSQYPAGVINSFVNDSECSLYQPILHKNIIKTYRCFPWLIVTCLRRLSLNCGKGGARACVVIVAVADAILVRVIDRILCDRRSSRSLARGGVRVERRPPWQSEAVFSAAFAGRSVR